MQLTLQHILGLGFLILGMVSISSYSDDLSGYRISWFYRELKPMKERWGETTGTILHFVQYVLTPVGFGLLFLHGLVVFS